MAAAKKKSAKKTSAAPAKKAAKPAKKSAIGVKLAKPAKATPAQKRLHALVATVASVKDADAFCDKFFVALSERINELNAAEEYILYYLGTEILEREVESGGFVLAFINLGRDSQFIDWAKDGYRALGKPKAAALLQKALLLAKKDEKDLLALAKAVGTKRGIDAYLAYRAKGTFSALEDQAEKDLFFTKKARVGLVKKYKVHFAAL